MLKHTQERHLVYRGWAVHHRHHIQCRAEKLPSDKQLRYFITMTTMEFTAYNQEKNVSDKTTGHVTELLRETVLCCLIIKGEWKWCHSSLLIYEWGNPYSCREGKILCSWVVAVNNVQYLDKYLETWTSPEEIIMSLSHFIANLIKMYIRIHSIFLDSDFWVFCFTVKCTLMD